MDAGVFGGSDRSRFMIRIILDVASTKLERDGGKSAVYPDVPSLLRKLGDGQPQ